ncbi:MAG: cell wall hydrolase [Pseudomonadota bacterium]
MSDAEKRHARQCAAGLAVGAAAIAYGAPAINARIDAQIAEEDFRYDVAELATLIVAEEIARPKDVAPLLSHPWLQSVEYALERQPETAFTVYAARARDGRALDTIATFAPKHMDLAETHREDHRCLAEAVYYEARSESPLGQLAVAEVVANRVNDHRYPNSYCGVVYQGSHRNTGCQFTFTCDGALSQSPRGDHWYDAEQVAANVMMGLNPETLTGAATHYHTNYVNPYWSSSLVKTERIGTHIFYRFPRGSEWRAIRVAQNARAARAASRSAT